MEIQYVYVRKRKDFGRHCKFQDRPAELMVDILPNPQGMEDYIQRDPVDRSTQTGPRMSEHEINTEGKSYDAAGMNHVEGGWPKDINSTEMEQVIRYKKKIEKDELFISSIKALSDPIDHCIRQNNSINIYEEYFNDVELRNEDTEFECKALNVFRDPNDFKRTASHISWYPEAASKLAVAYTCFDFQRAPSTMSNDCYIWDVEIATHPEMILRNSAAPTCCIEFNPKDNHILVGGAYNGQMVIWDTRKGPQAAEISGVDTSHRDPVTKALWLQSKTGTEFFSASTDANVLWWDIRKMSEPVERMLVDPSRKQDPATSEGATCLEFESTLPTKFMVGTDRGRIVSGNRKGKTAAEKVAAVYSSHIGPVYALQRNPFYTKNFLTIGDWSARIWNEEVKDSPILWSHSFNVNLTDGAWSPVRPGTFFTTRMDGALDIWDICYRQKNSILSIKVADEPLYSLRVNESGRFLAVGSYRGVVTLMKCSDSLVSSHRNEKQVVSAIFDRETRREKFLEVKAREMKLKEKEKQAGGEEVPKQTESREDLIRQAEEEFWKSVNKSKQQLAEDQQRPRGETNEDGEEPPVDPPQNGDNEETEKPDDQEEGGEGEGEGEGGNEEGGATP